jgi:hypothetical protein
VSGGLGSAPVEVWGETGSAGATALRLGWRRSDSGEADRLELPCEVRPDADTGEMLRLLYGARLIADLESGSVSRERLAALSQEYGLASRAMSLVAVARRAGDQSGLLPRTAVMPLAMPLGVTGAAYFGQASLDSIADVIGAPLYRFEARRRAIGDLIAADGGIEGADLAERMARTLMAMLLLARRDPDGGEMRQLIGFARSHLAELAGSGQRDLCRKVLSVVAAGAAPAPDDTPDDTPEIAVIDGATWEAVAHLMRNSAAKVML